MLMDTKATKLIIVALVLALVGIGVSWYFRHDYTLDAYRQASGHLALQESFDLRVSGGSVVVIPLEPAEGDEAAPGLAAPILFEGQGRAELPRDGRPLLVELRGVITTDAVALQESVDFEFRLPGDGFGYVKFDGIGREDSFWPGLAEFDGRWLYISPRDVTTFLPVDPTYRPAPDTAYETAGRPTIGQRVREILAGRSLWSVRGMSKDTIIEGHPAWRYTLNVDRTTLTELLSAVTAAASGGHIDAVTETAVSDFTDRHIFEGAAVVDRQEQVFRELSLSMVDADNPIAGLPWTLFVGFEGFGPSVEVMIPDASESISRLLFALLPTAEAVP